MKKTALVTGGRRGIGRAIAARLSRDGFNVAINAVSPPDESDKFADMTGEYLYIQGDVGKTEDRVRILAETLKHFGALHVLVNNAGIAPKARTDLLEMSEESFDNVLAINAKANMFLTQAAAKIMLKQQPAGKKRQKPQPQQQLKQKRQQNLSPAKQGMNQQPKKLPHMRAKQARQTPMLLLTHRPQTPCRKKAC